MKLTIDPMPGLRVIATTQLNEHYARQQPANPRALAHRRKAEHAAAVLAGAEPRATFVAEATLRGLSVQDFARLVTSKATADDDLDASELERQRRLLAVEAASSPAEITAILNGVENT